MNDRSNVKYIPRPCPFLKKEVWAILTKQRDSSWRIVNCLDKDKNCFELNCAFCTDGGQWPFHDTSVQADEVRRNGKHDASA